ncbi:MAG: DUF6941 family protein [Vicinamibacteria bacterium]
MPKVKVTMLLADAAQEVGGKLYILGGGWSIIGPDPATFAIAVYMQTPWDQANLRRSFRLELLDADGQPVVMSMPNGDEQKLVIEGQHEAGRPPGLKPGTPLDGAFAVNFAGMPLPPGQRLEFRLSIDGETDEDWTLPFTTRPPAEPKTA